MFVQVPGAQGCLHVSMSPDFPGCPDPTQELVPGGQYQQCPHRRAFPRYLEKGCEADEQADYIADSAVENLLDSALRKVMKLSRVEPY